MKRESLPSNEEALCRVVVDTNLWISFLIGKRLEGFLDLLGNPWFEPVSSQQLNEEILRVARRPKFHDFFNEEDVNRLEEWMTSHCTMVEIGEIPSRCRDPKDDFLLELAVQSNAIYLVSGDEDLLELGQIGDCKICLLYTSKAEWS